MRRLRSGAYIREMLEETAIRPSKLIYPLFVDERLKKRHELELMPGQFTYPVSEIGEIAEGLEKKGLRSVILFGVPGRKDVSGSGAYSKRGVVQRAIREIKGSSGLLVAADLCLCEYTSTGHCGITASGDVDNDATLDVYDRIALSQAEAGADMIAPSGMMDGQVGRIRAALDGEGYDDRIIMAYASKSASSFYGDRKSYQLNFSNGRESMREMELDEEEGADILMIKPALPNLDLIFRARRRFDSPIAAYNVSGEYGMVRAASAAGMLDYRQAVTEIMTSIFRAGADLVVSYHAPELADWLES
jgi:porphobilinogen synthase